ncbi:MAG: FkbM family methyltransferase [Candidatus Micrarchaeota archaeon]
MGFSIASFGLDLYLLSKGRARFGMKARIFADYLKITLKYLILVKLLRMKLEGENFLNFHMEVPDYAVFYDLFKEIFIKNEYCFESGNKAPHVIDCGANIGMAVLYVKHRYPGASIVAFEPGKEAFSYLERNCKINGLRKITLNNVALGGKDGKISFYSVASGHGG